MAEAKAIAANTVFECQSLAKMAALKQTIHDEAHKEAAESF